MTRREASLPTRALFMAVGALFALTMGASSCQAQTTDDPFPNPIETEEGLVVVDVEEFAFLPDVGGEPVRMMLLVDEPGTERLFVNGMRGLIYTVSYDGAEVDHYLDISEVQWGVALEAGGRERGFHSFAFHPEFGEAGAPGYGRFYTWTDTSNNQTPADFLPYGGSNSHHTVLLEWMARTPSADRYDGGPPRELMRFEQPFGNHNGGLIAFNRFSSPEDPGYGLLYMGSADGGSGGDPLNLAQDMGSGFGKILRIDPLGSSSANGQYGVPPGNPFVGADAEVEEGVLPEIYASGMRNPQRFDWDPVTGNLFVADIGQRIVEKVSLVPAGGNLGWSDWEGSYRFISRSEVALDSPRSDPAITYPLVEYGRQDPLMQDRVAVTIGPVVRGDALPALRDRVLFGDFVSGEILHFDADDLPEGGASAIRRVLLRDRGEPKTFLQLIQERNIEQGREPSPRTDLRFGSGPNEEVFLLNKHDGTIRRMVANR